MRTSLRVRAARPVGVAVALCVSLLAAGVGAAPPGKAKGRGVPKAGKGAPNVAASAPSGAAAQGAAAGAPTEQVSCMTLQQIRDFIFQKMEYDEHYFGSVVQTQARGKALPGLTKQQFGAEVERARLNLPILERFTAEKPAYASGKAFTLPTNPERYRVYANLIALMNMVLALEQQDFRAVADYGRKVIIRDKENLGLVRGERADYYVQLFREYFYLMAVATYRLGNDKAAVDWFARLEADADLQALKSQIAAEPQVDDNSVAVRLEEARKRPLAILPLGAVKPSPDTQWLGSAVMELLTSDLVQHSSLFLVERGQLDKVLGELAFTQSGLVDERLAAKAGGMLNAGALIVGTYTVQGKDVVLNLHLVDARDGVVLASADGEKGALDSVAAVARAALTKLLKGVGWLDEASEAELAHAQVPKADTLKALMDARLLLATKPDAAKDLYAKAMEEDPSYARLFQDLQAQFSDITATVAVMPFVNASASAKDAWMVTGVAEALASDLPRINFTVVERARIVELLEQTAQAQALGNDDPRLMGEKLGADFLVLGSILHVQPQVRLDLRFVEVRTGLVAFSTSAEDRTDDFMAALTNLSAEIVRHFNREVPPEILAQLAGKKMSKDDFEKYVREKLAKEALDRSLAKKDPDRPPTPHEERVSWSKWIAGGAAVGLLGSGALLWRGTSYYGSAREATALRNSAASAALVDHYQGEAESLARSGNLSTGLGVGLGVAALSAAAYAFYDLWLEPEAPAPTATGPLAPPAP